MYEPWTCHLEDNPRKNSFYSVDHNLKQNDDTKKDLFRPKSRS